jgi:hypothetical protein
MNTFSRLSKDRSIGTTTSHSIYITPESTRGILPCVFNALV